jgi:hypothetical protein
MNREQAQDKDAFDLIGEWLATNPNHHTAFALIPIRYLPARS